MVIDRSLSTSITEKNKSFVELLQKKKTNEKIEYKFHIAHCIVHRVVYNSH